MLAAIYRISSRVEKEEASNKSQKVEKLFGVSSRLSNSRESNSSRSQNSSSIQSVGSFIHLDPPEHPTERYQGYKYFLKHLKPELSSLFCASLTIYEPRP